MNAMAHLFLAMGLGTLVSGFFSSIGLVFPGYIGSMIVAAVIRNIAGAVAVILVVILLAVSLFIIANTIKLATFNRREEIAIMKMCGATNAFVRWPFVFEGLILGLVGAVAAFFLQWGIYVLVGSAISGSDTISLITVLPFQPMALRVLGVFVLTGFVIGAGGSVLAIRKFLQV